MDWVVDSSIALAWGLPDETSSVVIQRCLSFICHSGLTRNPVLLGWIPAFAGMTTSEFM